MSPGKTPPPDEDAAQASATCSFCDNPASDVGPLIAGPAREGQPPAYICRDCAELCRTIFDLRSAEGLPLLRTVSETAVTNARLKARVDEVLRPLSEPGRQVVKMRHGLTDGFAYSIEEIATTLDLSPERVREIETEALAQIRKH